MNTHITSPIGPIALPWSLNEFRLAIAVGALVLIAMLLGMIHGPISQSAHFHDFADARSWFGVPHAGDVLSNLGFAVMGIVGLRALAHSTMSAAARMGATTFFGGLLLTCVGSAFYHWAPADSGLAVDRFAMTVAFAGLLGWLASEHVSSRAGIALLGALMLAGPGSVALWATTGDLGAYVVVQFGGMVLTLTLAYMGKPMRKAALGVLGLYVAAKVFEGLDHQVLDFTGHWVSGHSLKHIAAALAAWPLIAMVRHGAAK